MKQESILTGGIGLLTGVLITGFIASSAVNNNNTAMMGMMGMDASNIKEVSSHDEMSMAEMTSQLANKSGDDFDKAFVEMMISHHQGAIAMAELIPSRAKHDELKNMGKDIISAQTKEVSDMKRWQKEWNYTDNEIMQQMHGGR